MFPMHGAQFVALNHLFDLSFRAENFYFMKHATPPDLCFESILRSLKSWPHFLCCLCIWWLEYAQGVSVVWRCGDSFVTKAGSSGVWWELWL